MPDRMTGTYDRVEVITSVQRRRRWTPEEKIQIVEAAARGDLRQTLEYADRAQAIIVEKMAGKQR